MGALRSCLVAGVLVAAAVLAGSGSATTKRVLQSVTCSGGSVAPGHYDSIDVTGFCDVPGGIVWVRHDLTIESGARLNAIEAQRNARQHLVRRRQRGRQLQLRPEPRAPDYVTFEDNFVAGTVDISGYTGCWFGFIRNRADNGVTLDDNVNADPDAMEVVSNIIFGDLSCFGNSPTPQVGDSGGTRNVVFGHKLGQCAGLP